MAWQHHSRVSSSSRRRGRSSEQGVSAGLGWQVVGPGQQLRRGLARTRQSAGRLLRPPGSPAGTPQGRAACAASRAAAAPR